MITGIILFVSLALLLVIGVPIAMSLGISTFIILGSIYSSLLTPTEAVGVSVVWAMAQSLGTHVIHFGMIVSIANVVGTMTPPVAVNIFSARSISKLSIGEIVKGQLPFFLGHLAVFFVVILFPTLSTFTL